MAYQVNRFNGTFLVSVADGTIDSSTDLRFVGKNYAGYGQVQNENFLHLLENFSGSSQPPRPVSGQLWFDSVDRKIKVYDGIRFRVVGGAVSSAVQPSGLSAGEFWFDNQAQQLYCWTGSEFQLIGPENPTFLGETSVTSQVVKDISGTNHTIAKFRSGGQTIAVVSKDTFDLNVSLLAGSSDLAGFGKIKKGITLVDTNNDTGVTSLSSGTVFWGTSQTAKNLIDSNGNLFPVTSLVRVDQPLFSSSVTFAAGFSIGSINDPKLSINIADNTRPEFTSQASTPLRFKIRTGIDQVATILDISNEGLIPGLSSVYRLGSENSRWFQIYADNISVSQNLIGNVVGNTTGIHTGNVLAPDNSILINATSKEIIANRFEGDFFGDLIGNANSASNALKLNDLVASVSATANTVVARDASGNVTAVNFVGIARFADRIKIDNSADDSADPFYKTAKTNKSPNSIAARNPSGDLFANIFNGTATAVQGADLAEKYLADQVYEPGTVVAIGGEKEIRASQLGDRAIGAVSTDPGFMMNQDQEGGTYVALKGRIPMKVLGPVNKGDRLIAANGGVAIRADFHQYPDVFAIALGSNDSNDVQLIEAIVL